ncbi:MAG: hypothetical protein Tsb0015_04570 [Simkaniaceae bacterium]
MGKKIFGNAERSKKKRKQILKTLGQQHTCFVLVTCDAPSDDGEMQVEMNFEGDKCLAMYLLENAYAVFQKDLEQPNEER